MGAKWSPLSRRVTARAALGVAWLAATGGCGKAASLSPGESSGSSISSSAAGATGGGASDAQALDSADAGAGGAGLGLDAGNLGGEAGGDVGAPTDAAADGAAPCKRGVATNAAPSGAFAATASSPGVTWWYDWSNQPSADSPGIEFVPMIWGAGSLTASIPTGSLYLLGFNEPNFNAQADLTPEQAALDWPMVEAIANGVPIGSPAVNFCGSASDTSQCTVPTVTDPYTYLQDFFADCLGCKVDFIAVHWYNCDLPSLQAYLEGNEDAGGTLEGFVQFGKPIWLTEFSCDTTHSVADQQAYMQAAVPYLESNPHVFRYSWFSASAIPNAELMNGDGSLTALGETYVGLPESCR